MLVVLGYDPNGQKVTPKGVMIVAVFFLKRHNVQWFLNCCSLRSMVVDELRDNIKYNFANSEINYY